MTQTYYQRFSRLFADNFGQVSIPQKVVYVDPRLGFYNFLGWVGIAIFVLIKLFYTQSYLLVEQPTGLVTPFVGTRIESTHGDADYATTQVHLGELLLHPERVSEPSEYDKAILTACGKPAKEYAFKYSDDFLYDNIICPYQEFPDLMYQKEPTSIFVKTFAQVSHIARIPNKGTPGAFEPCTATQFQDYIQDSDWLAEVAAESHLDHVRIQQDPLTGMCTLYDRADYLFFGGENLTLFVDHRYGAEGAGKTGSRPPTVMRAANHGKDGNMEEEVFESGEIVAVPIWRVLEVAGVDLDSRHVDNPTTLGSNLETGEPEQPYMRLTGVTLHMEFKYYNYKYRRMGPKWSENVNCVLQINPKYVWSSLGNTISHERIDKVYGHEQPIMSYTNHYQHGIYIVFSSTGTIGEFSIGVMMSSLAEIIVWSNFIVVIMGIIAHRYSGHKSATYKAVGERKFTYGREYARFALASLPWNLAFNMLDENNSGQLSRAELKTQLHSAFNNMGLTHEELDMLVEIVFAEADKDDKHFDLDRGKSSNILNTHIDKEEFLRICNPDHTSINALKDLLRKGRHILSLQVEESKSQLLTQRSMAPREAEAAGLKQQIEQELANEAAEDREGRLSHRSSDGEGASSKPQPLEVPAGKQLKVLPGIRGSGQGSTAPGVPIKDPAHFEVVNLEGEGPVTEEVAAEMRPRSNNSSPGSGLHSPPKDDSSYSPFVPLSTTNDDTQSFAPTLEDDPIHLAVSKMQ